MYRIYALHCGEVAKDDLVGANSDDWAVYLEQFLDGLALLETENVCSEPKVGYGSVPRAGNSAERGDEKV